MRPLSEAACGFGRQWGYDAKGIWVNGNCRAEFAVRGKPKTVVTTLACEAPDAAKVQCPADTKYGVALVRQLGDKFCVLGRTWDFDATGVWVSEGCRAQFALGGYRLPNLPPNASKVVCEAKDCRTAPCASFRFTPRRGIVGHSMGGFGVVHFAMTRAEVFSAAYAISPCCLDAVGDIGWGNQEAWIGAMSFHSPADADAALAKGDFYPVAAYGLTAAMIPDASLPTFARMPMKMDHGMAMPSDPVYTAFVDQFPVQQVRAFRDNLKSLRGFGIEYGTSDQFADIPPGVTRFTNALSELRIPYTLDVYDGDHRKKVVERMATIIFPFFSRLLDPAR